MRKISLLVFMSVMACSQVWAQPPDTLWTVCFDAPGYNVVSDVHQTADGGYVGCGSHSLYGLSPEDVVQFNLDSEGTLVWYMTWPRLGSATRIFDMPGGDFLVFGTLSFDTSQSSPSTFGAMRILSYGDTVWTMLYGDANHYSSLTDVVPLTDGGYFLAGYHVHIDSLEYGPHVHCMRLGSNYDAVWARDIRVRVDYFSRPSAALGSDGTLVTAFPVSGPGLPFRQTTVGLNADGDSLWSHRYFSPISDGGYWEVKIRANQSGYVMAGSYITDSLTLATYLMGLDFGGDSLWFWSLPVRESESLFSVDFRELSDGGFVVAGFRGLYSPYFDRDTYILRLSPSGDTLWTKDLGIHGEDQYDTPTLINPTTDNGYLVVRNWTSSDFSQTNACVIRLAPDPTLAATGTPTPLPERLELSAYPNPFNATTTITFTVPTAGAVELRVYDVTGRLAKTLVDEVKVAGTHCVTVNGTELSSGVYFARLTAASQTVTQKLLLIK